MLFCLLLVCLLNRVQFICPILLDRCNYFQIAKAWHRCLFLSHVVFHVFLKRCDDLLLEAVFELIIHQSINIDWLHFICLRLQTLLQSSLKKLELRLDCVNLTTFLMNHGPYVLTLDRECLHWLEKDFVLLEPGRNRWKMRVAILSCKVVLMLTQCCGRLLKRLDFLWQSV